MGSSVRAVFFFHDSVLAFAGCDRSVRTCSFFSVTAAVVKARMHSCKRLRITHFSSFRQLASVRVCILICVNVSVDVRLDHLHAENSCKVVGF